MRGDWLPATIAPESIGLAPITVLAIFAPRLIHS